MNGLLRCAEILAVLLFIPWSLCDSTVALSEQSSDNATASTDSYSTSGNESVTESKPTSSEQSTERASTVISTTSLTTTPTPTTAKTWTLFDLIENKTMMTCAVLILACAILLISTLALACKVCRLRRRLRAAGGSSEYWMGMDKTSKVESQPEAKEDTFLLTENGQTTKESDAGATKQDGGKVDEVKQQGDEKEVGDSQKSEGAAATAAAPEESSPPSKPAEETTKDPPPPSSSENTEEPKKEQ